MRCLSLCEVQRCEYPIIWLSNRTDNHSGAPAFVLENATQTLAQKQHDDSQTISCYQCHAELKPEDARAHVGAHILRAMRGVKEPLLSKQVSLPDPCGFCGRSGCSVDIEKNGKTLKASSGCKRQHSFAYGHAKKYSAATPSTNVPLACVLCPIIPPRKTPPVFWKCSIYAHIRVMHPRYWDDLNGAPSNLDSDFADKIAISREELTAFGVVMGLLSAPSAQSISGAAPRGKKRPLDDVTNATAASGSNKRVRQ
ncbi:hypothetical protein B0H13DRAFT_1638936 [Mycena leptocephala]|nr:hypothetical protein B0H13DRAFT_1638936 [Mycena leptocephala]